MSTLKKIKIDATLEKFPHKVPVMSYDFYKFQFWRIILHPPNKHQVWSLLYLYTTYLIHVTLEGTDFSLWKKEGYAQDKEGFFYLSIFEIWDNLRKKKYLHVQRKKVLLHTYLQQECLSCSFDVLSLCQNWNDVTC